MAVSLHFGVRASCPQLRTDSLSSRNKLGFESALKFVCVRRERGAGKRRGYLKVCCERAAAALIEKEDEISRQSPDEKSSDLSVVMKFGGSSVASAERMREVASLVLSFPEERPVIVLSAMGKTTNKLLQVPEN